MQGFRVVYGTVSNGRQQSMNFSTVGAAKSFLSDLLFHAMVKEANLVTELFSVDNNGAIESRIQYTRVESGILMDVIA